MIRAIPMGASKPLDKKYKNIKQLVYSASCKIIGTWLAVSPGEVIPDEYKPMIEEGPVVRAIYKIPSDWRLIRFNDEKTDWDLLRVAKRKIESMPAKKTIKEVYDRGFLFGIASPDLNYPMCYNYQILADNPWIDEFGWKIICIGAASFPGEKKYVREDFMRDLDSDILYDFSDWGESRECNWY